ncbi:MFS transporter [Nocardioides carbamazepini]|uniref:MFS transporter n=1 Tax=Nocardioides carbamazepini TaxID=2854259 RepID=UPI00214A06D8|nr:MFS transporter [Nocardioides carbamazepini]MCR1786082.1 MFS transporter [Nocardioides carbamazepini]
MAALAVAELLSWGVLYYTYPVAAPRIAEATGWSHELLMLVYSICLVSAAAAGVWLGRTIDHAGDLRRVMPWCTALGCAGMALSATAVAPLFLLGWVLVGVAQAGCLWTPAFIAITRWYGDHGSWPMTVITAVGGSASVLFAPLVAHAVTDLGWRPTFVGLAVAYGTLALPLQLLCLRTTWAVPHAELRVPRQRLRETTRQPRFILLQLCMLVAGVALFGVTLNLVPVAVEKGATYQQAAIIFGLVGLGQVIGRVGFTLLPSRGAPPARTRGLMLVAALALLALALAPPVTPLAALAVLAGAVRGSHTLLMRDGVLERWGPANFGAVMGWFNLPVALGIAVSPSVGALLATATGSYTSAVVLVAGLVLATSMLARRT